MRREKNITVYNEATETTFTIPRTPALTVGEELYRRLCQMEIEVNPNIIFDGLYAASDSTDKEYVEFTLAEPFFARLANIHQQLIDLFKDMMGDPSTLSPIATDINLTRLAALLEEVVEPKDAAEKND